MVPRYILFPLIVASLTTSCGCQGSQAPVASTQPPAVPVSRPVQREVTNYVDFTGRTDAVQAVDIRPRVTGYLVKMPFKEGSEVKKGDLLFEVEPLPYLAQFHQARSEVGVNQAALNLAKTIHARGESIHKENPGAISQQLLDEYKAGVDEAEARVKASQARTDLYKINVDYTRVTSPIDGQVSRYFLTIGNLVNQDQTLLTTVVSLDPMYVYFDLDEQTLVQIRTGQSKGLIRPGRDGALPVQMELASENGYPHAGTINFVNNQVNPTTGSITMRGVFPNPKLPGDVRLLSPGMFVRVRLPMGAAHPALLIIDRAIGSDQGQKYLYVLDAENKVQYRRVTTGPLQDDGLRVIAEGLKPDDRVVVGGLQQVRPRMEIRPDEIPMPALGPSPEGEEPPSGKAQQ